MVKEDIDTIIDRLLELVKANGEVSLNDASAALGRQPGQIEKLALLLEESGLIEVRYTLMGIKLVAKKLEAELPAATAEKAAGKKSEVIEESDRLEQEVLQAESLLEFFETDLERRIAAAGVMIKNIEKREDFTPEELAHVKKEVELALKQLESFSREIEKLVKHEQEFYDELANFRKRLSTVKASTQAQRATVPPKGAIERVVRALNELFDKLAEALLETFSRLRKGRLMTARSTKLPPKQEELAGEGAKKKALPPIAVDGRGRQRSVLGWLAPIEEQAVAEISKAVSGTKKAALRTTLAKTLRKRVTKKAVGIKKKRAGKRRSGVRKPRLRRRKDTWPL